MKLRHTKNYAKFLGHPDVGGVNTIRNSSRRLLTDSVDNLETERSGFDYVNFDRY